MGGPLPPVTPSIMLILPLMLETIKLKKVKILYVPFTFIHPTDTQTDTPTCMIVAPDTLQLFTKFQP